MQIYLLVNYMTGLYLDVQRCSTELCRGEGLTMENMGSSSIIFEIESKANLSF